MRKEILKRLEALEQRNEGPPVSIWYLYQLPDGSEERIRAPADSKELKEWEAETEAKCINVILEIKDDYRC